MSNTNEVIRKFENELQILNEIVDFGINKLNIKEISDFNPDKEYEGIKAITFDGLNFNENKTKVFAYVGFPENVQSKINEKVPAMVLVHGGAGYPFLRWVKEWNNRGFAAIAVSTVGVFPNRIGAGDREGAIDIDWSHNLKGVFAEKGYVSTPDNDDMRIRETQQISEMWMYHAISQVLLAYNVITSYEIVDNRRVGAVGISWGSVILSLALGYRNKFSFAINVYGSGYLEESLSFMRYKFILPLVQDLFLAERRFANINIPVLWICMNNDNAFSANSNSLSFMDTFKNNKNTVLSIKDGWIHGHSCCWDDVNYPCGEIYEYAKSMAFDNIFPKMTAFSNGIEPDGKIWADFYCENYDSVEATLYYMTDEYEYSIPFDMSKSHIAHSWKKLDVIVKNKKAEMIVPFDATVCYIELKFIISTKKITISTPLYFKE